MFREIVKDVYIGKSQLRIWVNGKRVPKETLVKDIALPTLLGNKLPDYGTIGILPSGNSKLTQEAITNYLSQVYPRKLMTWIYTD